MKAVIIDLTEKDKIQIDITITIGLGMLSKMAGICIQFTERRHASCLLRSL